jgi:hypothetical protein
MAHESDAVGLWVCPFLAFVKEQNKQTGGDD